MATRSSIEFDFQQAKRQADRLDQIASQLRNLANDQFEDTMNTIAANWKGENATAYLGKGERLQGKIKVSASDLNATANDIRRIAKRLYDAEMENLRRAELREY